MNPIYRIPGKNEENCDGPCECESPSNNTEKKFIESISEKVCEILNIGWNDRRIVKSLIINGLENKLDSRGDNPGLLQQYEAYVLEKSSENFRNIFKIPKDIKVNHEYASHAKYNNIAYWIRDNWTGLPQKTPTEKPSVKVC